VIKDETTETVEVKRNHLSMPATHYSRTTPSIESSQGYIMRRLIVWRVNKQGTTSSIEAELLALLQTVKEAIFISRLLKAITLRLNEPLIINCDNTQTL
jgi:hypothetical protein